VPASEVNCESVQRFNSDSPPAADWRHLRDGAVREGMCAVRIEVMPAHAHGIDDHRHSKSHTHGHSIASSMNLVLGIALAANLLLVAVEFIAGYFAHSISLISDAVHNLTDVPTLAISWLAARLAERPPTHEKTYGYHRAGILAAFANAVLLVLVAVYILYESYERLRRPVEVHAVVMLWVALLALGVNGGIAWGLIRGRRDLNLRAILTHSFGDALSNVAIIAGALAIRWAGVNWVDPALGIAIGGLVLWSAIGILRESSHILLEGLPRHIRLEDVAQAILKIEGVQEVHDIHIWTLGTDLQALSCHIRIPDMHMEESEKILARVQEGLAHDFHITHVTVQFERAGLPESGLYMPEPVRRSSE
jgi:cobalt-zinc-cadmium efflux system protein